MGKLDDQTLGNGMIKCSLNELNDMDHMDMGDPIRTSVGPCPLES